ncbi:MAG: flavin monoamine oxidase family protein [Actinomycetota bacterium]
MERDVDVVVVGAGLAGLTAAAEVAAAGRSVAVLEARSRVGGRLLAHDLGQGKAVELGGQWIGPGQARMYALARDLGVDTFPTYDEGDGVAILGDRRYRFSGSLPRMNPVSLADLALGFRRLERMARRVPTDRPWDAPGALALDAQTLETWIRRHVRTARAGAALRLFVEAVFTTEADMVSLLFALYYMRSGISLENLITTSGGAQQDRFVGGSHLVAVRLAERLGDAVRLGSPVRRIESTTGAVVVHADGAAVRAHRVIVAVPPALAGRIAFDPPLPGRRDQLTQRMPHGATIKAMAMYDEPFWRGEGLSGQAGCPDLPVGFTFDNSPPDGKPGVLVAFVEGDRARELGGAAREERRRAVLASLVEYFGPRAAEVRDYGDLDWTEEEWTRGCYGGHMPPGVLTRYGPALREPVGPIHWAGTETARVWTGYMEGAVESGRRAAGEVLGGEPRP